MNIELPEKWKGWTISEKIGEGSFGTVYKAELNTEEGRQVSAVKIIHLPLDDSEKTAMLHEMGTEDTVRAYLKDLISGYMEEIRLMYSLQGNEHIVRIEDHCVEEKEDGLQWFLYIRMELLTSFVDYADRGLLTERDAVRMGQDICKALVSCEELNIIHRDIKPDNIFVDDHGTFKLGDFGIARRLDRSFGSFSAKGTFTYMAPEIYRGEKYGKTVDLYSLGIVLYRLMNHNRDPFVDLSKQVIYYRDREKALSLRMGGEELPAPADASEGLAAIIQKACQYRAELRYRSAKEMLEDLDRLARGEKPAAQEELQLRREKEAAELQPEEEAAEKEPLSGQILENSGKEPEKHRAVRRGLVLAGVLLLCLIGFMFLRRDRSIPEEETETVEIEEETERSGGFRLSGEASGDLTEAEQMKVVKGLLAKMEADHEDSTGFGEHFRNTSNILIRDCYNKVADYLNDSCDEEKIYILAEDTECFLACVVRYNPSTLDRGSIEEYALMLYLSEEDGIWKFDGGKQAALNQKLDEMRIYPEGLQEIYKNIEKKVAEDWGNFMYLYPNEYYEELVTYIIKFLWEDEEGIIHFAVWATNGTEDDIAFRDAEIELRAKNFKIAEFEMDLDLTVLAHSNVLQCYTVPAEEVVRSDDEWIDVTSYITSVPEITNRTRETD